MIKSMFFGLANEINGVVFTIITFLTNIFDLIVLCENAGWKEYLSDNPTEFHDIPLKWQNGSKV